MPTYAVLVFHVDRAQEWVQQARQIAKAFGPFLTEHVS